MTAPLTAAASAHRAMMDRLRALYPDHDDDDLFDTADGESSLSDAIERVLRRIAIDEGTVAGIKAAKADLDARKARIEQRIDGMRGAILQAMQDADMRKMNLPSATLSVSDRKPGLVITDEAALPAQFVMTVTSTKPDKDAIKDALASGEVVPGAQLGNGGATLTIRRS